MQVLEVFQSSRITKKIKNNLVIAVYSLLFLFEE